MRQVVPSAGEPNDAQALEDYIQPTSLQNIDGLLIYAFAFGVSNFAVLLPDPTSGKSFVLAGQAGSPNISSFDLPVLPGVSAYEMRYEVGGVWSAFQAIQPGVPYVLGPNVDGVEFDPLDSKGENVAITDSFLFDMNFLLHRNLYGGNDGYAGNPAGLATSNGAQYTIIGFPAQIPSTLPAAR